MYEQVQEQPSGFPRSDLSPSTTPISAAFDTYFSGPPSTVPRISSQDVHAPCQHLEAPHCRNETLGHSPCLPPRITHALDLEMPVDPQLNENTGIEPLPDSQRLVHVSLSPQQNSHLASRSLFHSHPTDTRLSRADAFDAVAAVTSVRPMPLQETVHTPAQLQSESIDILPCEINAPQSEDEYKTVLNRAKGCLQSCNQPRVLTFFNCVLQHYCQSQGTQSSMSNPYYPAEGFP